MEKKQETFEVKRIDLLKFADFDLNSPLSELEEIISEAKEQGADGFFIDLSSSEYGFDTCDLVLTQTRLETDEEFEYRMQVERDIKQREEIAKRQLQEKFEQEERAQYLRLKAKYENGKEN